MTSILIVTHGEVARALSETINLFLGETGNVTYLALYAGDEVEAFRMQVVKMIVAMSGDVLVLCDLKGGSPMIASLMGAKQMNNKKVEVVTGVNLPMLLEILMNQDSRNVDELAKLAVEVGQAGIERVTKNEH